MPELSYTSIGVGEPLIVLHGLFGSGRNWQSHSRRLAERFQVISVDLRNHGMSSHHALMDYTNMATDVLELMDRLGLESADVLGHSMGGKVAMQIALQTPARVDRLIVVDIAPRVTSARLTRRQRPAVRMANC